MQCRTTQYRLCFIVCVGCVSSSVSVVCQCRLCVSCVSLSALCVSSSLSVVSSSVFAVCHCQCLLCVIANVDYLSVLVVCHRQCWLCVIISVSCVSVLAVCQCQLCVSVGCLSQITKMELQLQQQRLISMEGIENSTFRALVTKLINVALGMLAVILVFISTISNFASPFLTSRSVFSGLSSYCWSAERCQPREYPLRGIDRCLDVEGYQPMSSEGTLVKEQCRLDQKILILTGDTK